MGFFSESSSERQQRDQFLSDDFQPRHHDSSKVHELLAGGAAFEAMRAYEQHEAREGKPQSHAMAKEILAGLVGAEDESSLSFSWRKADTLSLDKLAETKGLDGFDRERAKFEARQRAEGAYDAERM